MSVDYLAKVDSTELAEIVRDLTEDGANYVTLEVDDDGRPVQAVATTDHTLGEGEVTVVIRKGVLHPLMAGRKSCGGDM
jgi:hypothetical protein